jgi:hypothetical protein
MYVCVCVILLSLLPVVIRKKAEREREEKKSKFFFCNPGNINREQNDILRLYLFRMSGCFIVRSKI